jgi:leucyl-tRNA synthetase
VLANEQVIDGCCWRHEDTLVEQRDLEQWFLRITKYAHELLTGWTSWTAGRKKCAPCSATGSGAAKARRSTFAVDGRDPGRQGIDAKITVFTTRVDTIFGATSVQLAPEHPLVKAVCAAENAALRAQIEEMIEQQKAARETGDLARSRSMASLPGGLRSIRSTASACRSGWRTTSWRLRHGRDHERAGA